MRPLLALLATAMTLSAAEPKGPANRLAKESSPYLLQHAHNPVDWYPWGPEAFAKAKKENKLVFLSIGYSSCHWCHVMERESFADAEVAKLLNEKYVCIKVDREERPDIDEIYMTALQALDARGGWPLSMFLTDDAKPIVGGTYWPKEDRKVGDDTARGFKSILNYMADASVKSPKEMREQADTVAKKAEEMLTRATRGSALVDLNRSLAMGPVEELRERIDPVHGGIGNPDQRFAGTKFPMPATLAALGRASTRDKDEDLKKLVSLTLRKMAEGGLYDQLGGGFHRYSTERTWTVPHFEKMLYDNAQLIELYAEAFESDPQPHYARVVDETFRFLKREMMSPDGAFYAALDADSDGKEGEFYVWTGEEIEKALGQADAQVFRAAYSVSGPLTFEEKAYVLKVSRPWAEVAKDQKMTEEELRKKIDALKPTLLAAREKRTRPFLDTKIITAWNGQMIAALARAGQSFKKPEYTQAAVKAAEFVLAKLRTKEGRLLRTFSKKADGTFEAKLNGYLDDYAFLAHGLLNLHSATGDTKWLTEAKALTDAMTKWHGDGDRGGLFYAATDGEKLFARPKDYHDGVQPSGNSVAARNLVRLATATKDVAYRTQAEKSLKQFAGAMRAMPSATPHMAESLHLFLDAGPAPAAKEKPAEPRGSAEVVTAKATLGEPDKEGVRKLTITLVVADTWHIYANPVGHGDLESAKTEAALYADGKKLALKVEYPKGTEAKDDKGQAYRVYEKEVTLTGTVSPPAEAKSLEVRVKLMACDSGRCLAPATLTIPVK